MLCAQPTTRKWGSTMTLLTSKFSDPDRGEVSYLNGHAGLEPPKSLGTVASLQIVFCESSMKWFSSQTCNKIILWLPPPPAPSWCSLHKLNLSLSQILEVLWSQAVDKEITGGIPVCAKSGLLVSYCYSHYSFSHQSSQNIPGMTSASVDNYKTS